MSYNPLWDGVSGDIAPPLNPGSNNDVDATQYALIRTGTVGSAFSITGFEVQYDATNNPTPQRSWLIVYNNSGQTLTLKHQDTGSVAQNRLIGLAPAGTAGDVTVLNNQRASLVYDSVAQRWLVLSVG